MKTLNILEEVRKERINQEDFWNEQNHSPIEWISILTEEVGEAAKEALDYHFKNPVKFGQMKVEPGEAHQKERLKHYRKELIQVAAVAVQMIESVDRNELSDEAI